VALLLAVTGCTAAAEVPQEPANYETQMSVEPNPLKLIGVWSVSGAPQQSSDQWMRIDQFEFALFEPCGVYSGGWRARDGLFVSDVFGVTGEACDFEKLSEHWLRSVTSYVIWQDGTVDLTDVSGVVVASLSAVTTGPPPGSDYAERMENPPVVTAEARAAFARPRALPADASPVLPQGRWIPVQRTGDTDTYLEFERGREPRSNGFWTGSDGCNKSSGRWFVEADGHFAARAGLITMIGCEGSAAPYWMQTAAGVGMVGDELTFYDAKGNKLGSLTKDAGSE